MPEDMPPQYRGYRDLKVYQLAYSLALEIFEISKTFPAEEKYSLTDQIRRCSRSIPANIAEAWRRRKYEKAFVSKLTDSSTETAEVEVWIDFCRDFKYINTEKHLYFTEKYAEVGRMLTSMINHPEKFCVGD
jgi:four helix bundle protein